MPLIRPDPNVPIQALFKRAALLYLPVVAVFSVAVWLSIGFNEQRQIDRSETRESSRVQIARGMILHDFSVATTELQIIANLPVLKLYLNSGNSLHSDLLSRFFLLQSRVTKRYDQIRLLNTSGREIIRVNYNNGQPVIVPREQLQDKSDRYYFRDTIKLEQGEMYVSPLDLNLERGQLEVPYKPMIRLGMPVFDSAGRKKGIIVLNYFGGKLLQNFRDTMKGGDPRQGMLLNSEGYWLSSPKSEDEWGFMLGKYDHTYVRDFPEEWRTISASEEGAVLTEKGLTVYATVYPLLSAEPASASSVPVNEANRYQVKARKYQWKIVSFVPHAVLARNAFYNETGGRILLVMAYLLPALAAWIITVVTLSRKQARLELTRSNERYNELVRRIPVGIFLIRFHADGTYGFEYVSPAFCRILGLDADAVLRDAGVAFAAAHPDDRDSLIRSNQEAALSLKHFHWEGRFVVHGETRWMRIDSDPAPQRGRGSLWSGVVSDITESKELENELKYHARIDILTGLNNRRHFFELAEQELERAKRYGAPLPVLMLDVDHFKLVNDTYGHHAGDKALQKLSEVFTHTLRGIDIQGRLGGEEFAILLPEIEKEHALEVAERLRLACASVAVPLDQGGSIHFTVSIGVTCFVATDKNVDDMLKRADIALYAAKNGGRDRVCFEGAG